jgi:hypothetical protein
MMGTVDSLSIQSHQISDGISVPQPESRPLLKNSSESVGKLEGRHAGLHGDLETPTQPPQTAVDRRQRLPGRRAAETHLFDGKPQESREGSQSEKR